MTKVLGIDLGTNSIGWSLLEENTKILDGGVVIFPRGNNEDAKTGKESSFAQQRTTARGARRRLFRRKLRRERILSIAKEHFNLTVLDIFKDTSPLTLYKLRSEALDNLIKPSELFRIFLYFAKKRGFLSNRKELMRDSNKDLGVVKQGISNLQELIHNSQSRTLGEYYYKLISDHFNQKRLNERILERWTSREMYEQEFDLIISKQVQLGNKELDLEIVALIRKETFYQRSLKSAKNLVGKCRLESSKRCMPRSHPTFQEFRIWQNINNIKWANPDTSEVGELNQDQKQSLFELFSHELKVTESKVKKVLGFSTRVILSEIELKPCTTLIQLHKIFLDHNIDIESKKINNIYHSLLYTQDNSYEKFKNYLNNKYKISSEIAQKLWNPEFLKLEQDYSNISHKAAIKLLPYLKKGLRYDEACIEAGYHHSLENKFKNYKFVPQLKTNELRNPVVQKSVSTSITLINNIIQKHGKPDIVRIELARELKKPKIVRERIRYNQRLKEKKREEYIEILSKHFGRIIAYSESILAKYELWLELGCKADDFSDFDAFTKEIKKSDLEKYKLWLEADRISPYSGQVISLSQLINSKTIEIEHIIPFSRSLDNSFANKTLCERDINKDKDRLTPLEYFNLKPSKEMSDFKRRIARFSNPLKREQFLKTEIDSNFLNSQISDTAYIARIAVQKISQCIEKTYTTKGGLTSIIRKSLGLNSILHYDGTADEIKDMKNRGDHRHHLIDAITIALTTHSLANTISRKATYNNSKLELTLTPPWNGFRSDVEDLVNRVLVVHKFPKKLVKASINKYKYSKSERKQKKQQFSLRDVMHEETLYGKILNPYTGQHDFVFTKKIRDLDEKKLEKIVDLKLKEFLKARLRELGSWKELIKNEIIFNDRPLRRVRLTNPSTELPLLREETKTYIEPGNNYCQIIYESDQGKRSNISLNYYEAARRKLNKELLYPPSMNDKKLLFSLTHYDKFILYKNNIEEIDWANQEEITERLYHVIKFGEKGIFLGKSNLSKIRADYDKVPIKIQCNHNTIKAVKIKLNLLGEIIWRSN
ncbi:MAG: hypothetical protein IT267_01970 [Saprospiraceae bacterium]|nr:hypothetical protein [Saprospiraceae bacterium]